MKIENIEGKKILALAKKLFPLNRSILGPDIRKTIEIFKELHEEFKSIKFKTGEKVFDWEVPQEWIIYDAYIEHESGQRFAEFKKNNLHVIGYSEPVNKIMTKEELLNKINHLPNMPNAIPYVTSYYKKKWGFCLENNIIKKLPSGKYKAFIDSKHVDGYLDLIEAVINKNKKNEIFFSSNICHPSMANNELSGPCVLNEILSYIKKNYSQSKFTYRFVLLPETIGSISYLSKRIKHLKKKTLAGFNLVCCGDNRAYSHIESRNGNTLADKAIKAALIGKKNCKFYSYLKRGSDERQYCAPGVDIPLSTFCRSRFESFPEYHTSLDNFDLVNEDGLQGSFDVFKNIIDAFEFGLYPKVKVLCEPQLGKRNLYREMSNERFRDIEIRTDILSYCDGEKSIFDICNIISIDLFTVLEELKILKNAKLID